MLEKLRAELKNTPNTHYSKEDIIKLCEIKLKEKSNLPIKRVINATGTIMHTNLGRSPIDEDVWQEVKDLNIYSNNLEYNINKEGRGLRGEFLYTLLAKLTGAEDALVVNNNAASVFLILKTLAREKEVNGFYESSRINDFPIRDKKVTLVVKRRRWLDKTTGKSVGNRYELTAEGTRHSKEFAAFLKGIFGQVPDSGQES